APQTKEEESLCALWSKLLQVSPVGATDNFFALGGNSLLAVRMAARLKELFGRDVPVLQVFEHPTVRGLVAALTSSKTECTLQRHLQRARAVRQERESIAIVGMACRFPGADDVEALWRLLTQGKETVSFFKDAELDPFVPKALSSDPRYVKARGVLKNVN